MHKLSSAPLQYNTYTHIHTHTNMYTYTHIRVHILPALCVYMCYTIHIATPQKELIMLYSLRELYSIFFNYA